MKKSVKYKLGETLGYQQNKQSIGSVILNNSSNVCFAHFEGNIGFFFFYTNKSNNMENCFGTVDPLQKELVNVI